MDEALRVGALNWRAVGAKSTPSSGPHSLSGYILVVGLKMKFFCLFQELDAGCVLAVHFPKPSLMRAASLLAHRSVAS